MSRPDMFTGPAAFSLSIKSSGYRFSTDEIAYSFVTPLWLVVLVVIGAAVTQWFYADRVVITAGASSAAVEPPNDNVTVGGSGTVA